ncbi:LYR motif-containing protein 4 isoform X1 [Microcaecilia unicolor]|uniref:LYR motif-containing protein 4 isoform X1 n=1 Tax=Microcaecilia unicolor TaxID=1415580 RepID=A0A6P7YNJ5_9AMPH|nr:LYR motif-containing protein 4 isoform X1 [Microcaecilia unicolor]
MAAEPCQHCSHYAKQTAALEKCEQGVLWAFWWSSLFDGRTIVFLRCAIMASPQLMFSSTVCPAAAAILNQDDWLPRLQDPCCLFKLGIFLDLIHVLVTVGHLYSTHKLVIEHQEK